MKRIINIFIILIFLTLSGCMTKIYLGKEKEQEKVLSDEMVMSSRAIDPTTVPAGGTWGTVRGILNTNFGNINGTLDSIEVITTEHDADIDTLELQTLEFIDSLAAHRTELDGKLNLSDSVVIYSTQYDLLSGLATKQNTLVSGTSIKTINSQTLLGSGNITIEGGAGETDSTVYATRYYTGTTFAPIANPIFTGVQKVSTTDTLATQAYARQYGGTGTVTLADVQQEISDSLDARIGGGVPIADIAVMQVDSLTKYVTPKQLSDSLSAFVGGTGITSGEVATQINDSLTARLLDSDTIPLFIFGLGSGHSSDTAVFNNGRLAGAFYNSGSDTLYVTELRGVLVEGTGTETIDVQVSWDVNMKDATPTNLNTTALTVTSMTTGTSDATFDNNGIPPGVWVWSTLSGASSDNKPTMLILTMTGYKRNRSY